MPEETTPKRIFLISVFRRLTSEGAELVAIIPIDAHKLGLNSNELEFLKNTPLQRMDSAQMTSVMGLGTVTTDFQCMRQMWMPNEAICCDETNLNGVVITAVHPIVISGTIVQLYEASLDLSPNSNFSAIIEACGTTKNKYFHNQESRKRF